MEEEEEEDLDEVLEEDGVVEGFGLFGLGSLAPGRCGVLDVVGLDTAALPRPTLKLSLGTGGRGGQPELGAGGGGRRGTEPPGAATRGETYTWCTVLWWNRSRLKSWHR